MTIDHFRPYCAVFLVFKKDNSILLQRRKNTGFEDGNYGLVSGHLDGGESAREAMVRETYEEAGIKIEIDNLKEVHTMHFISLREYINLFFTVDDWKGTPKIMEPNKCDDLPPNTIKYIKLALENIHRKIPYSEFYS